MQQNYAKLCGVTETVEVVDLVEDSLRLNAGAFARHGVTLRREFGGVPQITVDKHKVLQILVNLMRNAKYACDESGRSDKLIILRIEPAPAGVRIAVIDNGIGIPPENMSRLFSHGFTTRAVGPRIRPAQRRARRAGARRDAARRERRRRAWRRLHARAAALAAESRARLNSPVAAVPRAAAQLVDVELAAVRDTCCSSGTSPRSSFCCTSSQYSTVSRSEILLAETAPREAVHELHAVLELLRQKNDAILEEPIRHGFFSRLTVEVRADLDVGQLLDGVVVEQEYAGRSGRRRNSWNPRSLLKILVAALLRMQCPRLAMTSRVSVSAALARYTGSGMIFICTISERRRTPSSSTCTLPADCAAQLVEQGRREHAPVQPQIEIHDVVEHAARAVDLVHQAVLVDHRRNSRVLAPLVRLGGMVADDLQMVRRTHRR